MVEKNKWNPPPHTHTHIMGEALLAYRTAGMVTFLAQLGGGVSSSAPLVLAPKESGKPFVSSVWALVSPKDCKGDSGPPKFPSDSPV